MGCIQFLILMLVASLLSAGPVSALLVIVSGTVQDASPGDEVVFEFTITNNEAGPLDIQLLAEEEFDHSFSPSEFRLYQGDTETVQFRLSIPAGVQAGRHESEIQVLKEQVLDPRTEWLEDSRFSFFTEISISRTGSDANSGNPVIWLMVAAVTAGILLYRWRHGLARRLPVWLVLWYRPDTESLSSIQRRLLQEIGNRPGIGATDLSREISRNRSTVYHNLRQLKQRQFIKNGSQGGWFEQSYHGPHISRRQQSILKQIKANHGKSLREMAKQLEMSPSTLHYHLKRLEELGLLPASRGGGEGSTRV